MIQNSMKIFYFLLFFLFNFNLNAHEIKIIYDIPGDGLEVVNHSTVYVHYIGTLEDNTQFDNSYDRGEPINFQIGTRKVIQGWELGILGMKKGGKRKIYIPSPLAYGKQAIGNVIPENSNLIFELEIIEVLPPKYKTMDSSQFEVKYKDNYKIIDIRTDSQRSKTGIIPGSLLITAFDDSGEFIRDFFKIYQENVINGDNVIFVSEKGEISSILANGFAENLNQSNIYSLKDGIQGLVKINFNFIDF